eukprot:scaffold64874_cov36-Tisochrysis_lutea.AAC.2
MSHLGSRRSTVTTKENSESPSPSAPFPSTSSLIERRTVKTADRPIDRYQSSVAHGPARWWRGPAAVDLGSTARLRARRLAGCTGVRSHLHGKDARRQPSQANRSRQRAEQSSRSTCRGDVSM